MRNSARLVFAGLLLLSGTTAANQQEETPRVWSRLESAHFTVYTAGGTSDAVNTFNRLEAARAFMKSSPVLGRIPDVQVTVILFDGREDFSRYEPHPQTFAFYRRRHSVSYIVVKSLHGGPARALVHEYIHAVFANIAPKLPLWLAEGLAEAYSEARNDGDTIWFGIAVSDHVTRLKMIPTRKLAATLNATADSVYANRNRVWDFYALSWAAVHTLITEPKYSCKLSDFILATNETDTDQALRSIYGVSMEEFTRDVERHIAQATWGSLGRALTFGAKPEYTVRVASQSEISQVLADVMRVIPGLTPRSLTFPACAVKGKHQQQSDTECKRHLPPC